MPAIAECLEEAGIRRGREAIGAVVCGAGPGSFTSLRVAGSVAKGLAAGYGVDLYAVSSLVLAVTGAKPPLPSGEYVSLLDAMRGEFFAARIIFNIEQGIARTDQVGIMGQDDLDEPGLAAHGVRLIGPGKTVDTHPHARGVAPILKSILAAGPVDLALWEPDYGRLAEAQVRWEATHGRPLTP
jgi:tRNA threonylcarbamoyl adenosine modification protein YeaZ